MENPNSHDSFFNLHLHSLSAGELKAVLRFVRCTLGSNGRVACISLSEFMPVNLGKNIAQGILRELGENGVVLLFPASKGQNHKPHLVLNTERVHKLLEDLAAGKVTIEQFLASLRPSPPEEK